MVNAIKTTTVRTCFVAFILVPLLGSLAFGGKQLPRILAPWQGKGQVFKVAPNKIKIVGYFEGIMYVNDSSLAQLDTAIFKCPGAEYINLKTKSASIETDCIISKGKNRVAYATIKASGKVGQLKGDFTIVGGEGKWKGISGKGKIAIRTAMGEMAVNRKTSTLINSATGLAIWHSVTIKFPSTTN